MFTKTTKMDVYFAQNYTNLTNKEMNGHLFNQPYVDMHCCSLH